MTTTDLQTYDPVGRSTRPGQDAELDNVYHVRTTTKLGKMYVMYRISEKRLVNYDAPARSPVYDRSYRLVCAHTRAHHRRFSHITHTHTQKHPHTPIPLIHAH